MKTYLEFSVDGDINELKTNDKLLEVTKYDYKFVENINYLNYYFILLYNKCEKDKINITKLPFYNNIIYGNFIVFMVTVDNNIKSLSEKKLLKLIIVPSITQDYSSDDFDVSE